MVNILASEQDSLDPGAPTSCLGPPLPVWGHIYMRTYRLLTEVELLRWSSRRPGLSPETIREVAHLKVCLHPPDGATKPELTAPTAQGPGGQGSTASPLLAAFVETFLWVWPPPGCSWVKTFCCGGGLGVLSVSDRGLLYSKMPVMAPSRGGLCSFCCICQCSWQLAMPTGKQERFFWSVVLL